MADQQNAIVVKDLYKTFKLPHEKHSGLKQAAINMFKGKRGYESQKILNDISFEIKKGEFFGIVGRNGSGKSTLLKLLAGIYAPDSGLIQVNGSLTPFIELGVGFNPELTGRENVFLNGALLGFSRDEMGDMYNDIVEFAEIEKFMDQKLKNYSSGMQVRLAFSIAIRADTDILVLDEVLAVGDSNFQKKCFDYFYKLKENKKTVILVSHSMESVVKFCDKAMLIDKGKIVITDNSQRVSEEYIQRNIDRQYAVKPKDKDDVSAEKGRPVSIKSVKTLDSNGKDINSFVSNQSLCIQVKYEVKTKIKELNIGVSIRSESDTYILGYNTQMDDFKVVGKKGDVELCIEALPLLQGKYYVSAVCFGKDETIPFDFKPKELELEAISFGNQSKYRGMLSVAHEWKV